MIEQINNFFTFHCYCWWTRDAHPSYNQVLSWSAPGRIISRPRLGVGRGRLDLLYFLRRDNPLKLKKFKNKTLAAYINSTCGQKASWIKTNVELFNVCAVCMSCFITSKNPATWPWPSAARAQVTVLQWRGSTHERGNPEGCEGGKGVYG